MMRSMGWSVGDGKSIQAWHDPWLSTSQILQPTGPPTETSNAMKVYDLLVPDSQDWNQSLIKKVFPELLDTILSIKPSKLGAPDKLFWLHTKDGIYTTKSGYIAAAEHRKIESERNTQGSAINWNKGVWSLHTSPKIQLLMWKAFKGALPVGEQLQARQLMINLRCKRCGKLESTNHLLFQCGFAAKVWKGAPFAQLIDIRGSLDLETDWLRIISIPCAPPVGFTSGSLAPWIVWALWIARNNLVFNDRRFSEAEVLTKAIVTAKEWLLAQTKEEKPVRAIYREEKRHLQGQVVQTDAAWNASSNVAGLGWILKNPQGNLSFQATSQAVKSPLIAEGLALREAVKKYKELGFQQIQVQSDSAQLIKALNSNAYRNCMALSLTSNQDEDSLPEAVSDLLGKRILFEISVNADNIKGKSSQYVVRMANDDREMIEEFSALPPKPDISSGSACFSGTPLSKIKSQEDQESTLEDQHSVNRKLAQKKVKGE
ncbi:hypothetical protein Bca101_059078 [Brassica carinata]